MPRRKKDKDKSFTTSIRFNPEDKVDEWLMEQIEEVRAQLAEDAQIREYPKQNAIKYLLKEGIKSVSRNEKPPMTGVSQIKEMIIELRQLLLDKGSSIGYEPQSNITDDEIDELDELDIPLDILGGMEDLLGSDE